MSFLVNFANLSHVAYQLYFSLYRTNAPLHFFDVQYSAATLLRSRLIICVKLAQACTVYHYFEQF